MKDEEKCSFRFEMSDNLILALPSECFLFFFFLINLLSLKFIFVHIQNIILKYIIYQVWFSLPGSGN